MFPKKSVIRYDFPARGSMPPVKIFWHDGLKETPKIEGVPDGLNCWVICRRSEAPALRRAPAAAITDLVAAFSTGERYEEARSPRCTRSGTERQRVHRR